MNVQECLYKFCKSKNIKKVLRLDNDIKYWNVSNKYTGVGKEQMKLRELKLLYGYYIDKVSLIDECYENDVQLLIISHDNIELLYGLLVCFLIKYADLPISKSVTTVNKKIDTQFRISSKLSDLIKHFEKKR